MSLSLSPRDAWQPLPARPWNAAAARHLLRRTGWTARPDEVERAVKEGLPATLDRLFPAEPPCLEKPRLVSRFEGNAMSMQLQMFGTTGDDRLRRAREFQ